MDLPVTRNAVVGALLGLALGVALERGHVLAVVVFGVLLALTVASTFYLDRGRG